MRGFKIASSVYVLLTVLVVVLLVVPSEGAAAPGARGARALPPVNPHPGTASSVSPTAELVKAAAAVPPVAFGAAGVPAKCSGVHQAQYVELNPRQRSLNAECAYLEARASVAAPGWVQATGNPPAFYLYDFVMTYDSLDQYVVVFGAPILPSDTAAAQTWVYRGGNWSQLQPGNSPSSCVSSVFADDPIDGYVLYFAGTTLANGSVCPSSGQTWGFHAGSWTRFSPSTSPSPRFAASFSNDSTDGYLVLFGGISALCGDVGNACNDTWTWNGGNWTQLHPPVGPSNRSSAGMTFDAVDGYVLLFGGEGPNGSIYNMLNDTWSFSGGVWTPIPTTQSPPQPVPDGLAFDYAEGFALYTQVCGNITNDARSELTWEYAAGAWNPLNGGCGWSGNVTAPPQRLGEGTAYDAVDGYFVLFGGGGIYFAQPFYDTWTYRSGTWTSQTVAGLSFLPKDNWGSAAYDDSDHAVVLFGGGNDTGPLNSTWEYVGGAWRLLHPAQSPSPRYAAGIAYDALDGYTVLFGGNNGTTSFNDTWEFLAGSWTRLTPSTAPSPRSTYGMGMVYDGADGYVLLFGGTGFPDTWTFHAGVWTNITASAGYGPGSEAWATNLAYDANDGYVVQFGSYQTGSGGQGIWLSDTWSFLGGHWTDLTNVTSGAPSMRWYAAFTGMGATGGVLLFGGLCVSCSTWTTLDDTWVYENHSWTRQVLAVAPPGRYLAYLVYDDASQRGLLFGGRNDSLNAYNPLGDFWYWEAGGAPSPFVTGFRSTPPAVDEGATATLTLTVEGGTAPLTFSYSGLPHGCLSANASSIPCTPAAGAAGIYTVVGMVRDANGNQSSGTTILTVNPRTSIRAFTATPSSPVIGERVVLSVNFTGGTGPWHFAYTGLPPGCSSQTVPSFPCTTTVSGTYLIQAVVIDSEAVSANASLPLNVSPLASGDLVLSAFTVSPSAIVVGNATFLNATATSYRGVVTYAFLDLPPGCVSANVTSLRCQPTGAGSFAPELNVSDTTGYWLVIATNLTVFPAGGGGVLTLQAFGVTPGTITLGETAIFYAGASGGSGPYTYMYVDLPTGCQSANLSVLPCTPTAAGSFTVTLTVNDPLGRSVSGVASLTVMLPGNGTPPPVVQAFTVSPTAVAVGSPLTLEVVVSGGTLPLSFSYAGLPSNCTSANSSVVVCRPLATGSFNVAVVVTDAEGRSSSASVALAVVQPAPTATNPVNVSTETVPLWYVAAGVGIGAVAALLAAYLALYWRPSRSKPPESKGRPPEIP